VILFCKISNVPFTILVKFLSVFKKETVKTERYNVLS